VVIADECLLSGTAAEVIPVVKADGRVIGTGKAGPISLRMITRFREITREGGTPIYSRRFPRPFGARDAKAEITGLNVYTRRRSNQVKCCVTFANVTMRRY